MSGAVEGILIAQDASQRAGERQEVSPAPLPGAGRSLFVIGLGVSIIMVDGFDLQSIGFVAPEIARDWSQPIASFGPVFAAGLAGTIPGAMLAGPIARFTGVPALLALSLLLFGVGTLATTLVRDLASLAVIRFVVGLGLGAAVPLVMTIVAQNVPLRLRSTMVVVTLCGQPIGAIAGAELCARIIPAYGWQVAFLLGGVLPLLLLPLILFLPRGGETSRNPAPGARGRVRDLFGQDLRMTTLLLWATIFLTVLATYIIINWLPGILRDEGRPLEISIRAMSLFNAGAIAGAILMGIGIDRFGGFRVMPPVLLLAALSLVALDLVRGDLSLFLLACGLSGLFAGGAGAAMGGLTIALYPEAVRTTGTGWVMGVGRLGGAAGPLGVGLALAAGLDGHRLFLIAAVSIALGSLALFVLGRHRASRLAGGHAS